MNQVVPKPLVLTSETTTHIRSTSLPAPRSRETKQENLLQRIAQNPEARGARDETDALISKGVCRQLVRLRDVLAHGIAKRDARHVNLGPITLSQHNGVAPGERRRVIRIGAGGVELDSSRQHTSGELRRRRRIEGVVGRRVLIEKRWQVHDAGAMVAPVSV